ncbi:c-type cytochrome [Histidinibacterium aquaticum]|uniref:C-type cytochrome n=1 Tax=Histidinibacterium aquaticum TaxID=2613962 RepID=A0A5J5GFT1_9RHOB|nr:c-type cytochrome [Histidinibacterium aquaticum]KAA9006947.1 c-type cytochrome [Histidinibacterium aquaticum]
MRLTTKSVLLGLPVLFGAALAAPAQDMSEAPRVNELEARLNVDSTLFNATIDEEPSDDMLELGRLVAMGGAENGGSGMACVTCHGANGQGDGAGVFPRLAGLPGWYMYKQLEDYAEGTRPNRIMTGIAQRLTEDEREAVASYYAVVEAPWPGPQAAAPISGDQLQWGGQLAAVGSAEQGIPGCVNCHGPNGTGNPPSVPYLAGQYAEYMSHQLQLWREGTRQNDAMGVMETIASKMTDEDMRAVSAYYARVRPGLESVTPPAPMDDGEVAEIETETSDLLSDVD